MKLFETLKRNEILGSGSFCSCLRLSMRVGRSRRLSGASLSSPELRRAGWRSRPHPGGKLVAPLLPETPCTASDHRIERLRTPSLSSGTLVLSTQSRRTLGSSFPLSSLSNSTVPAGVQSPLDLSFSQPIASGTAPQSSRKCTRSSKSISAAGSRNSSSYWIL